MSFDTATTFSRTSHGRLVRRCTPLIRHCTAPHSTASPVTPAARFSHTGRFLGGHHWGCPRARQGDRACGPSNPRTVCGFSEDDHWETWSGNLLPISIGALSEEPRSRKVTSTGGAATSKDELRGSGAPTHPESGRGENSTPLPLLAEARRGEAAHRPLEHGETFEEDIAALPPRRSSRGQRLREACSITRRTRCRFASTASSTRFP